MQLKPFDYWTCSVADCQKPYLSFHRKTILGYIFLFLCVCFEIIIRNAYSDLVFIVENWDNWNAIFDGIQQEILRTFQWWQDWFDNLEEPTLGFAGMLGSR